MMKITVEQMTPDQVSCCHILRLEPSMSFNLCVLPKDEQLRVEVEKAAAYAVWKEKSPEIKTPAESEAGNYKGEMQTYFLQQVERYRKMR